MLLGDPLVIAYMYIWICQVDFLEEEKMDFSFSKNFFWEVDPSHFTRLKSATTFGENLPLVFLRLPTAR